MKKMVDALVYDYRMKPNMPIFRTHKIAKERGEKQQRKKCIL
jgi:hypothetical protein